MPHTHTPQQVDTAHCNTLQHTANTATHCNTLQHTDTPHTHTPQQVDTAHAQLALSHTENGVVNKMNREVEEAKTELTKSLVNSKETTAQFKELCARLETSLLGKVRLRHTATHTATHCNTLQHTATHCNTLQHTATHCSILQQLEELCSSLLGKVPKLQMPSFKL